MDGGGTDFIRVNMCQVNKIAESQRRGLGLERAHCLSRSISYRVCGHCAGPQQVCTANGEI